MDQYESLDPDPGEVIDTELIVSDDVLVKAFALGPGGEIDPHEHNDVTNVFHVMEGTVTVVQADQAEVISAPGVVHNEPGVVHGARNESDERAVLTASLCPMPGQ